MSVTITAILFTLIGIALAAGGAQLLMLGGSAYYIITGIAFLVTAILLFLRRPSALLVYAIVVIGSLIWAVWEVGLDWWQLGPRGGVVIILGLWLLTPWIRRPLGFRSPTTGFRYGASAGPLAAAVVVSIAVALLSMFVNSTDVNGNLPEEQVAAAPVLGGNVPAGEWHQYGRTPYGQRYSPLDQINLENVSSLQEVWRYQTGDVKLPEDVGETTYQVTPLKIGNSLYLCTPHNWAIAIDATTGKQQWKYDPNVGLNPDRQHQTCRGVSYYVEPTAQPGTACAQRVYLPTSDARLIALDATNGQVCTTFADNGVLHLEQGMPYNPAGYYYSTSPPVIVAGKIIIGGAVNDNYSTQEQSGVIRAFDVNSGALLWNWDSGNPTQTQPLPPGQTYTANSPNSWSVFSVDEELGLVYIPLGNQVPDQLGMNRSESVEKYSSSIVALDINTGADRWVRQTVHHDLWDMDVPAQPVLVNLNRDGAVVPALVGPTKQGDIYVLDRRTGEPIIPVTEQPAPGGAIPEDRTAPTQPISALNFRPRTLEGRDMWGVTMFDQMVCRIRLEQLKYEGQYTPPSLEGSIVYPGNFGTFNWGSVAVDPERMVMFGMPTYLAFTSQLVPRAEVPPKGQDEKGSEQGLNRNDGAPYAVRMGPFLGPLQIPCQAPPWGYVAGTDLRTGNVAYKKKNGTVHDMTPLPLPFKLGVPGIGGPMITKGGVAFLGAAVDNYLRAYNLTNGEQLWEARLPAGGQATPMTYSVDDGRQFVVMVAGGHGSVGTKPGDYVIAYALPR
ncbi:glucose/quinate/shikimate family membrane-bound PQQ-dependent dehydrogenase [Rhizobium sp. SAFR-030]|uniref:glucose/quinate/shikimate family membrane-bound PQQ-dependent dehydrogenase n=1 Tax=Rhizobium sp. SAFR-030 TaxID=3387277 RepID=UPI003F7F4CF9